MIPKIIHYCWLSGDTVPESYQKCMKTWHERLKNYKFVLWDTNRFDIHSLKWTEQAFEQKKYAYAADYIRLYAVYHYGGIYMDMDMEVVKPFGNLLDNNLMVAYETHIDKGIEAGCFGAEKGHPYIRECMRFYENREFIMPIHAPTVMGAIMCETFLCENIHIYSNDYFTARNIMTGEIEPTQNTFTIHHFVSGYVEKSRMIYRRATQQIRKKIGEKSILSKIIIFSITIPYSICLFVERLIKKGAQNTLQYYWKRIHFKQPIKRNTI